MVTSTTHKTLCGLRGGLILAKGQYADKLDNSALPLSQSGTLEHVVAAKAIAFREAMTPGFKDYIKRVILNAQSMTKTFNQSRKIRVVSNSIENHEIILDIQKNNLTSEQGADLLYSIGIATNKGLLPNEKENVMEGLRIGTPTITSHNFNEKDAERIAQIIVAILEKQDTETLRLAKKEVQSIT